MRPRTTSTATDTFRGFLDVLAGSLDEVDVTPTDLAARLHLSRFHVDRLVSSVAGETPSALRRRVLLERSAYRLGTSDVEILTIALEAGFDSHEGYTRAFRRAYGVPPSQWRRHPTPYRLGVADAVHFYPPGCLRLPSPTHGASMDLVTGMIEHHVWLVGQMLDRASTLDDVTLDSPIVIGVEGVDDDPTLRSLLGRLVGQMTMWELAENGASDYDIGPERTSTVADIRRQYDDVGPPFVALARRVRDEGLVDVTFVNTMCSPPELFTYGGLLAHVLTFAAHRRTLVCGALHDAGITDLGAGGPTRLAQRAPLTTCPPHDRLVT
jgi:AraC-like DNA-binding protein